MRSAALPVPSTHSPCAKLFSLFMRGNLRTGLDSVSGASHSIATMRKYFPVIPLILSIVACERPAELTAPQTIRPTIVAPTSVIATGVFIESAPLGKPGMTAWDTWTSKVGGRSAYIMWYTDWSTSFQGFGVTNAYSRGSIPVITWEMKNRSRTISYSDVLGGKWNKYIDTWAAAAKTDGREIFVRFGHEMNGDWYGWGGAANGANAQASQSFISVWRYVRGRFT